MKTDEQRKAARERSRKWRKAHPEKAKAVKLAWYRKQSAAYHTANKRRLMYGVLAAPPAACEVCGTQTQKLVVDHDHATGKVRGWLCLHCNCALGYAKDSRDRLQLLMNYLDQR